MRRVVEGELEISSALEELRHPEAGALVLFFGSVRGNTAGKAVKRLHYEVYEEMAEAVIRRIEEAMQAETGVHRVRIQHRVGDLAPGERTILVAALGRHRQEAFQACRRALERVKAEAPIWKKEVYEDGEAWVRHEHTEAETGV